MSSTITCESSTKFYNYVDKKRMNKYCNRDKKILDTLVEHDVPRTRAERFYSEEWIDVCDNRLCNINDMTSNKCYPTRKVDKHTIKIAEDLTDTELLEICGKHIIRSIDVPEEIIMYMELGISLLEKGYTRPKNAELEDFIIPYKNLSSETLFLWRLWMEKHGPLYIRKNGNYYYNFTKWINSDFSNKKDYSGAIEWLIKGGDSAYRWLQSEIVTNKIRERYDLPWSAKS